MPQTYAVTSYVTSQQLADIMVTAFEGGINYWCGYVERKAVPDALTERPWYSDPKVWAYDRLSLIFHDRDSEESWELTTDKIAVNLQKLAKERPELLNALVNLGDPADADEADTIVQYLLFGEVVFG